MPLSTFTPPIAPSPNASFKPQINLYEAEFGDGYTVTSPKGLNHIRQNVSYSWDALTEAQMLAIRTFFEDHGGYRPFYYQPRAQTVPIKWTCKNWEVSDSTPWQITAKFVQSFTNEI